MRREDLSSAKINSISPDEELMFAYQQGESLAFDLLYQRHKGKVYSYLNSRIKNRSDADDIFQQVFLKLHQSRNTYSSDYAFTQWLFTISKSILIDFYRKQKRPLENDEHIHSIPTTEDRISLLEEKEYYSAFISSELNKEQGRAVEMRVFNDESYHEIAIKLNTSQENVRQILSRSFKKLRMVLRDNKGGT